MSENTSGYLGSHGMCSMSEQSVDDYCPGWGVRPVVTLSADIVLTGSSEAGWTY